MTAKPVWLSSIGENCVDVVQSPVYISKILFFIYSFCKRYCGVGVDWGFTVN